MYIDKIMSVHTAAIEALYNTSIPAMCTDKIVPYKVLRGRWGKFVQRCITYMTCLVSYTYISWMWSGKKWEGVIVKVNFRWLD